MEQPGSRIGTSPQLYRTLSTVGASETFQATGSVMLARLEQVQGNAVTAVEHMNIAEKLTKEHHFAFKYTVWVKYALVRLWIAQGNLEKASHIVQESGITANDEIPYLREPEFLALLRLLLAQGDYDASLALSKRLLQKAETGKRIGRVIEVLVLQALIFQGRKETEQALAVLKRALSLPGQKGTFAPLWMKASRWPDCCTWPDRGRLKRSMPQTCCLYLKRLLAKRSLHLNF